MFKGLRVTQEYMYAMIGILFVLVLGLKDELLEEVVIPCDDTADSTLISTSENKCILHLFTVNSRERMDITYRRMPCKQRLNTPM